GLTERYPGYAHGFALLGYVYQLYPPDSPEAGKATGILERALKLDPTDSLAQSQLGQVLLRSGKAKAAVPHLEIARFLDPERTSLLFVSSRALRAVGRTEEALEQQRAFERRSGIENEI